MYDMKRGFTMIELIMVIVIIGILLAIAYPRLAATRDDAALATDVTNMSRCIQDAAGQYTATGTDLADGDSNACNAVVCFNITYSINGLNFIVTSNSGAEGYCADVDMVGGHLVKTYTFKGSRIQI